MPWLVLSCVWSVSVCHGHVRKVPVMACIAVKVVAVGRSQCPSIPLPNTVTIMGVWHRRKKTWTPMNCDWVWGVYRWGGDGKDTKPKIRTGPYFPLLFCRPVRIMSSCIFPMSPRKVKEKCSLFCWSGKRTQVLSSNKIKSHFLYLSGLFLHAFPHPCCRDHAHLFMKTQLKRGGLFPFIFSSFELCFHEKRWSERQGVGRKGWSRAVSKATIRVHIIPLSLSIWRWLLDARMFHTAKLTSDMGWWTLSALALLTLLLPCPLHISL